tara:strand:- start:321 stop:821 length:501 start_codon:yes stop_codon:yes gene_type:complete
MRAQVEKNGLLKIAQRLRDIQATVKPSQIAQEAQAAFVEIERAQFRSEGATGKSGKWAALSPKYRAWKQRTHGNKPILELSGRLKRSLTNPKSRDFVFTVTKSGFIMGSRVKYARFHMTGHRFKKTGASGTYTQKMPARPPISLTRAQMKRIVVDPIEKRIKRNRR